jgi:hypothetical protein
MTTFVTHPQDALAFVWREFPLATMRPETGRDRKLCGYWFQVGRSKHFAPLATPQGGVDFNRLRLWRDAQAYARDKRRAKAAAKRQA